MRLQTDYLSIPARQLVPMLTKRAISLVDPTAATAMQALKEWNFVLDKSSVAAGIYETWLRRLGSQVSERVVPPAARPHLRNVSTARMIEWLGAPANIASRDSVLLSSFDETVGELKQRFGPDVSKWTYGQPSFHHALITHPLSAAVSPDVKRKLDVGPAPRGGDSHTVGVTGAGGNQTSGASFRIVVDLADWDTAMGTNTPGQSGDPDSPHYRDLFELWANDQYFPAPYSRSRIEAAAERRLRLVPR